MDYLNPMFLIPALTGSIFVLTGIITRKFPPKKINHLYGYRSRASMKDQLPWDFAQEFSSKELINLGVLLALSGALGIFLSPPLWLGIVIGLGLMATTITVLIVRTEKAIAQKFGSH